MLLSNQQSVAARHARLGVFAILLVLVVHSAVPAFAQSTGDVPLDEAIQNRDADAIRGRFTELAEAHPDQAVRIIPKAYAQIEGLSNDEFFAGERYSVFLRGIAALSRIESPREIETMKLGVKKAKAWQSRLLILHAAVQNKRAKGFDFALIAAKDQHPLVVAAAANFLGRSKTTTAILPVLNAMKTWEKEALRQRVSKGRKKIKSTEGGRAWLACRDALHRLTGESLHAHADYRNFWKANKEKIDPTTIDIDREALEDADSKKTAVLFGLEVTGINIAFVLDISGSMEQTDPLTPEDLEKLNKKRTYVGDEDPLLKELLEKRRRIVRAKKELRQVIQSLPENKNFNVIYYSTRVTKWEDRLVNATLDNKKRAIEYLEGVKAKGVTATDDALARAFEDPKIDTVYLITDGAPTHIGMKGNRLPPDAKKLMRRIKLETEVRNHLRDVRIFTLGFEGAEEDFLQSLSRKHRGKYVRIR